MIEVYDRERSIVSAGKVLEGVKSQTKNVNIVEKIKHHVGHT